MLRLVMVSLVCLSLTAQSRYFVQGGPLFWYPHQSGLDYAVTSKSASGVVGGKFEDIAFDWGAGGRVGAQCLVPNRDFIVYGMWTTFSGCGNSSASAASIIPVWNVASLPYATKASAGWDIGFNMLDVGLKNNFLPRGWLDLSLGIGLKTAWIDQDFTVKIDGDRLAMQNDMWGIGPRFTLDSLWKFNSSWGLNIDGAVALLWSCFDVVQKETLNGAPLANIRSTTSNLQAVLEVLAGPYYQYKYADFLFRVTVGYDAMVFFCQNKFRPLLRGSANDGNLFFQGVSLNLLFGF